MDLMTIFHKLDRADVPRDRIAYRTTDYGGDRVIRYISLDDRDGVVCAMLGSTTRHPPFAISRDFLRIDWPRVPINYRRMLSPGKSRIIMELL